MGPSDRKAFGQLLADVYSFYGKEPSRGTLEIWFRALERFTLQEVSLAFSSHLQNPQNGQFIPKPADVIRALEGTQKSRAMIAWAKVMRAVGSVGAYRSVVFDDPLIHATIADMGGWPAICATSVDEAPFKAREFEQRYEALAMPGRALEHPPYLPGITERDNAAAGFARMEQPLVLGDRAAALRVFADGKARRNDEIWRLPAEHLRIEAKP